MTQQKNVGDFLANLVAPNIPSAPSPVDVAQAEAAAGVQGPVGAPPIDAEAIRAKAGAPAEVEQRAQQGPAIDPILMKEIELVDVKLKMVDMEEELLVQRIQETRRKRAELTHVQRRLMMRAKGLVVVGPNGNPQPAPR